MIEAVAPAPAPKEKISRKNIDDLERGSSTEILTERAPQLSCYLASGNKMKIELPASLENQRYSFQSFWVERNDGKISVTSSEGKKLVTKPIAEDGCLITIGRADESDVQVNNGFVSTNHLKIAVARNGLIRIVDTSTDGSRIDLKQVQTKEAAERGPAKISPVSRLLDALHDMYANFGKEPPSAMTGYLIAFRDGKFNGSYLEGLSNIRKLYKDRLAKQPELSDVRVRVEGEALCYPTMNSADDWSDLVLSLPDLSIPEGKEVHINGIFVVEQDFSKPNQLGVVKASIDEKQSRAQRGLPYAEKGVAKHGMLLEDPMRQYSDVELPGLNQAKYGGEFKLKVVRKNGRLHITFEELDGNSGGLQPRAYKEKQLMILRHLQRTMGRTKNCQVIIPREIKREFLNL